MGFFDNPFKSIGDWFNPPDKGSYSISPGTSPSPSASPPRGIPWGVTMPSIFDVAGAVMDYRNQKKNRKQRRREHEENMAMQREFAQNGIRWRVEDAVAAGLHPLAALGSGGASFSPSYSMGDEPSRGDIFRSMGQSIERAQNKTMTEEERAVKMLALQGMVLDNDNKLIENAILKRRLEDMDKPPTPTKSVPSENTMTESDRPWQVAGQHAAVDFMRTATGLIPIMPPMLAEALESDDFTQKQWMIRFKGEPNRAPTEKPSLSKLPQGYDDWDWSAKHQEWQPRTFSQMNISGRMRAERKMRGWYKDYGVTMRNRYPRDRRYQGRLF